MGSIRRRRGRVYSSEDLKLFTENFSQKNFLGNTQFGKLYRGKIPSGWSNQTEEDIDLTVKISACHKHVLEPIDHHTAFKGEVYFLRHPSINHHPNLVRLIGCCPNGQPFGVVYEINPVDTLHNLIVKGSATIAVRNPQTIPTDGQNFFEHVLEFIRDVSHSFNWIQRVKVALGFARLLDFLHSHESPYMVRNLDAAHILIDQDFNPVLSDFSMLSGGIMGDTVNHNQSAMCSIIGYVDPHLIFMGEWSVRCDVYIYGIILLSIIAKRVTDKERPLDPWVDKWAHQEYSGQEKCSLVHKSIQVESAYDVDDGCEITKLGMSCLDFQVRLRPTMKDIVKVLENLHVARLYRDEIGR